MSMLATQMGEHIKQTIASTTHQVFAKLGIHLQVDNIFNDLAQVHGVYLKSTFYVTDIDNVVRKDFNAAAAELKQSNPLIREFKVKFKRPDKPVRFFLEIDAPQRHEAS